MSDSKLNSSPILTLLAAIIAMALLFGNGTANARDTDTSPPSGSVAVAQAADDCAQSLGGDGSVSGEWTDNCESAHKPGHYARYYTFTLSEESDVTITLESDKDAYLYLLSGAGKDGDVAHENDDHATLVNTEECADSSGLGNTDSCTTKSALAPGTYTIEATTYEAATTGEFTLTVSGLGGALLVETPTPTPSDNTFTSVSAGL